MDQLRRELIGGGRGCPHRDRVGAGFIPPVPAWIAILALLTACAPPDARSEAHPPDAVRTVVDSILPIHEEIRRFVAGVGGHLPEALTGGEPAPDALVHRWVRAIERADTADLARMLMTPAEFIALFYPESRYTRPPWQQSPRLFWFLHTNRSSQGVTRVLERHGGRPLLYADYRCTDKPEQAGRTLVWGECNVVLEGGAGLRLFGAIIGRDGHYKFYSYASGY